MEKIVYNMAIGGWLYDVKKMENGHTVTFLVTVSSFPFPYPNLIKLGFHFEHTFYLQAFNLPMNYVDQM